MTNRRRRPRNDKGFFKGWEFNSYGAAVATAALVLTAITMTLALLGWLAISNDRAAYDYEETISYWVEPGDTLWTIARKYSTDQQDVRRVIDIIEQESDCTATIYPGQQLTIPVFN